LPSELRLNIWELFCPEITDGEKLTLPFMLVPSCPAYKVTITSGTSLKEATNSTRTLLAIHQETRRVALHALPDTLVFRAGRRYGEAVVRFKKERDGIMLTHVYGPYGERVYDLPRSIVENVAIVISGDRGSIHGGSPLVSFLLELENLKRVFYEQPLYGRRRKAVTSFKWEWFVTEDCHQEHSRAADGEVSVRCTPTRDSWPYIKYRALAVEDEPRELIECARTRDWEVVPVAIFVGDKALREYERLVEMEERYRDGEPAEDISDEDSSFATSESNPDDFDHYFEDNDFSSYGDSDEEATSSTDSQMEDDSGDEQDERNDEPDDSSEGQDDSVDEQDVSGSEAEQEEVSEMDWE